MGFRRWVAIAGAAVWYRLMLAAGPDDSLIGIASMAARYDPQLTTLVDTPFDSVLHAHKDIQNGGLHQFLTNQVIGRKQFQRELETLGLAAVANVIAKVNALFPPSAPGARWATDPGEMRDWLASLGIDRSRLDPLDTEYYAASEGIEKHIAQYIRDHRSEYDPLKYPGYVGAIFDPPRPAPSPDLNLALVHLLIQLRGERIAISTQTAGGEIEEHTGTITSVSISQGYLALNLRGAEVHKAEETKVVDHGGVELRLALDTLQSVRPAS